MRLIHADTAAGTTHTNSIAEAVLTSYAFPAYFWQAGKVVEFEAGVVVPDNNSTDTLTLYARLGAAALTGTAILTSGAIDVADDDAAVIRGRIYCRSDGAAGVLVATVIGTSPDASGVATGTGDCTVVTAVDTTATTYLGITGDWSVAHADNQCNSESLLIFEVTGAA